MLPGSSSSLSRRRSSSHPDIPSSSSVNPTPEKYYSATSSPFSLNPDNTTTRQIDNIEAANNPQSQIPLPPPYPSNPVLRNRSRLTLPPQPHRRTLPPLPPPTYYATQSTQFNVSRNEFLSTEPVPDLEAANLLHPPVEPAAVPPPIPNQNPAEIVPNYNLVDRIKTVFANFLASNFVRYLVKRTEEFRPEDGPHVMKDRFVTFQSNSTPRNDKLWRFFKWCYVVNVWLMILCLLAGVSYWKFGEGSGSNPKSFRFKDESMIYLVVYVGIFSTIVYGFWVYHRWNELMLFKIRSKHIGFLALDVLCDLRSIKAIGLTYYGFYDLAKKYGCWTDIIFVGFPVFYSIASISMLILFQHEFYHAHGLINDFIVIFVGPMVIQFSHCSHLNGVLYSIPIVFGRLSKFLGYIYRPHVIGDFYDPTATEN